MEDTVGKLKMLLEDVFVVVEGMMDLVGGLFIVQEKQKQKKRNIK